MIKGFKRTSLKFSKKMGLFDLFRDSNWRRRRLLILCYHGISIDDEHEWNPQLYMKQSEFEMRLEILKRGGCTILPLDEAVRRLYLNDLPDRSVAITFDDGYYDFYHRAYPVLEAFNFPATVYITTFRCGLNKPVYNLICSYILWKGRGTVLENCEFVGGGRTVDLSTAEGRKRALGSLISFAAREKLTVCQKDDVAESLAARVGVDYKDLLAKRMLHILNPQEVNELSRKGIDFQLHTHFHRTPLDPELFKNEIEENRLNIRQMTGSNPVHFCYPSGNHTPLFLPWLAEREVVSATTCEPGMVSAQSHPLLMSRLVDTGSLTPIEFEAWLTGIASLLARKRKHKGNYAGGINRGDQTNM
jgi:peptidoglycan/xylan/chitin deacetylase (PgdA/CDA1 family)